jgi:hypothetical protein
MSKDVKQLIRGSLQRVIDFAKDAGFFYILNATVIYALYVVAMSLEQGGGDSKWH